MDETLNGWKKFATLLPDNWLAETPQTLCFDAAWQTVGSGFLKSAATFFQNCRNSITEFVYSLGLIVVSG